jgi:hypothetical protein
MDYEENRDLFSNKTTYQSHERFYQVNTHLYAGVYPGDQKPRVRKQKLTWLLDRGVDRFINLMTMNERPAMVDYQETLFALAAKRKLQVVVQRFHISDMAVPTRKKMVKILDAIDQHIGYGHTVYVHCLGGYGRTGTVIGCWLARHSIAHGTDVLEYLDYLRMSDPTGQASPQTPQQVSMVVRWQTGM